MDLVKHRAIRIIKALLKINHNAKHEAHAVVVKHNTESNSNKNSVNNSESSTP